MSKKILLALDETGASKRAADFVEQFFDLDGFSVTAVNVASNPVPWIPAMPHGAILPWPPVGSEQDRELAEEAYARQETVGKAVAGRQAPTGADVEVLFGDVVEAIITAAEDVGADLIVVGSTDKNFLQRLFAGSVSQDLVRESSRPVLVVH